MTEVEAVSQNKKGQAILGEDSTLEEDSIDGIGFINSIITNLHDSPDYRGVIEAVSEKGITGWCLSTKNILSRVSLEVYFCGTKIGEVITKKPRKDIFEKIGVPIRAGFEFLFSSIQVDNISYLSKLCDDNRDVPLTLGKSIEVRIKGQPLKLPFAKRLNPDQAVAIAPILAATQRLALQTTDAAYRDKVAALRHALPLSRRLQDDDVNVIAYYLPQYHPFPENDDWWGPGFTEWTNVTRARPFFEDHYQPRLPADLGYYDLRVPEVQRQQVELAKTYGVTGFCFHYYWFGGKTLMTLPIERFFEEKTLDLKFCLSWANENWSRRWDGSEADILMSQPHTLDSDIAFIHDVMKYFKDDRYIKIDGAPLLVVYRASLLSDSATVIARWKEICRAEGFPDLHVSLAQTFELRDPNEHGCDSAVEFPPHGVNAPEINGRIKDLAPDYKGKIYDYTEVVARQIAATPGPYLQFPGVMPSWDNTSRRGAGGNVFHGATPDLFTCWLACAMDRAMRTLPQGHRYVFINAWNEWAEGAYLEPDRKNGHRHLRAVSNARRLSRTLAENNTAAGAEGAPPVALASISTIGTLENIVRLLQSHAQALNLGTAAGQISPMLPLQSHMVSEFATLPQARHWIERINSNQLDTTEFFLFQENYLHVQGWHFIAGAKLEAKTPSFLALYSLRDDRRYVGACHGRIPRPDVAASTDRTNEEALWSGFSFIGDLRRVAPGSYRVVLLLGNSSGLKNVCEMRTQYIVHIG